MVAVAFCGCAPDGEESSEHKFLREGLTPPLTPAQITQFENNAPEIIYGTVEIFPPDMGVYNAKNQVKYHNGFTTSHIIPICDKRFFNRLKVLLTTERRVRESMLSCSQPEIGAKLDYDRLYPFPPSRNWADYHSVFYFVFRDALTGNVIARLSFGTSGLPYTNDRIKNGEVTASGVYSSDEGKNIYELHCYLHAFLLQTPYSKSFMKVRNERLELYRKPQPRSVIEMTKEEEDAIEARNKAEDEEYMKERAEETARIEAEAREIKDRTANWDKDEFETEPQQSAQK